MQLIRHFFNWLTALVNSDVKKTSLLWMSISNSFRRIFSKTLVVFGYLWWLWLFCAIQLDFYEKAAVFKATIRLMLLSIFLPVNFFIWPLLHCAGHVSLRNANVSILTLAFLLKSNQINVIHTALPLKTSDLVVVPATSVFNVLQMQENIQKRFCGILQ